MTGTKFPHERIVLFQIHQQLRQPLLPLAISRNKSLHAEGVDIAHFVDIDGPVDARTHRSIGCHDIGNLQACDVECLAG